MQALWTGKAPGHSANSLCTDPGRGKLYGNWASPAHPTAEGPAGWHEGPLGKSLDEPRPRPSVPSIPRTRRTWGTSTEYLGTPRISTFGKQPWELQLLGPIATLRGLLCPWIHTPTASPNRDPCRRHTPHGSSGGASLHLRPHLYPGSSPSRVGATSKAICGAQEALSEFVLFMITKISSRYHFLFQK